MASFSWSQLPGYNGQSTTATPTLPGNIGNTSNNDVMSQLLALHTQNATNQGTALKNQGALIKAQTTPTNVAPMDGSHLIGNNAGIFANKQSSTTPTMPTLPNVPQIQVPSSPVMPTAQQMSGFEITAPTIQLPDYSGMSKQLQEATNASIESGLAALQRAYAPKYSLERERLSSRGMVGSGVENAQLANLAKEQGITEQQFVSEQQAKGLEQQFNLQMQQMDQQFQAAMQMGDWQQAAQINTAQNRLEITNLNQQYEKFKADVGFENLSNEFKLFDSKLAAYETSLKERGLLNDEEALRIEARKQAAAAAEAGKFEGEDFVREYLQNLVDSGEANDSERAQLAALLGEAESAPIYTYGNIWNNQFQQMPSNPAATFNYKKGQ